MVVLIVLFLCSVCSLNYMLKCMLKVVSICWILVSCVWYFSLWVIIRVLVLGSCSRFGCLLSIVLASSSMYLFG